MTAAHFAELTGWRDEMAWVTAVHGATAGFAGQERFGFTAQLQRAASISSRIAEDNAGQSPRKGTRFASLASGWAAELQTQALLPRVSNLDDSSQASTCLDACEHGSKMLYRLQQARNRRETDRAPVANPRSPE